MTNRSDKAVALKYTEEESSSPKVVAKGEGYIAEEIKKRAIEADVPIYEDDALVQILGELEIDAEIPPDLYRAVAEVLSWVYKANGEL